LLAALAARYSAPPMDREKLNEAYSAAMKKEWDRFPKDADVGALYAESLMNLRPWQLWSLDGKPAEGTLEIISVLEGVMKRNPRHTGANHYYIHAVEASPNPEKGMGAARRLDGLAPSAGHLVHMPSHIYLRTGDFQDAVKSNEKAIVADRNYIQKSGASGVYPLMYYNHNIHMLAASHAGNGNYAGAIKAARELESNVSPNVKAMPMLEMFMPYALVTLSRFQKWDEVMKYPQPAAELKITNAIWRLSRGLALANPGRSADAERELTAMREVVKSIPADAGLGNSSAHGVLKVADELLSGEIAQSRGDRKAAIDALTRAAAAEDLVNYNEPPDWHLPAREWLGRALLRAGSFAEAEAVYRKEIEKNPRNGRALFGLAEALRKQGKDSSAALVDREFKEAWANSDTTLTVADLYGNMKPVAANPPDWKRSRIKLKSGLSVAYVESGPSDGQPVILLHGVTDSSFSYSRVLPMLDKRFRYYALDLRGHGESDKPGTGYAMRDFASDVAGFMEAKGIPRAVVVGHSMGSFVAMQTALDHPQRVERLVLIGSATTANSGAVPEVRGLFAGLKDPIPVSFIRQFQVGTSSDKLPEDFIAGVVSESQKAPARVWRAALEGVAAEDYKPRLPKITVPVTIFWGEKETVFFRDQQDLLKAGLKRSELKIYPDAGHAPHWEFPERFAEDLNRILASSTEQRAG
jgi:pimeloyl-ACP methyl ester carboxylesterase/tetratricopeptide (TPR) repeat protein